MFIIPPRVSGFQHSIVVGDFSMHMNDDEWVETRGLQSVIWAIEYANTVVSEKYELARQLDFVLGHKAAFPQIHKTNVLFC